MTTLAASRRLPVVPRWITGIFLVALVCLFPGTASANRNILFIAIDDLRVEPNAITPNLDALATTSTVYTNAYTNSLWCLPSRTTVMFGLSAATHQVGLANQYPNYNAPPYTDIYDNPALKTLPELLSDAGYETAVTGKVFHDPQPSRWDVNGPAIDYDSFYDPYDPTPNGTFMTEGPLAEGVTHPDQVIADWAGQYIQSATGPFFLAVGFFQPHLPWIAPQWAYDLYPSVAAHTPIAGDLDDESTDAKWYAAQPVWLPTNKQYDLIETAGSAEALTRGYLAAVSHTDAMIGQVLDALANSVHAGNTDVVVWSDHGFHLGEKYHWRKRTYWQQTVRVPLIIQAANIPPGVDNSEVSLLDLPPTVLDMAGVAPSAQFEGSTLRTSPHSPVEIYHDTGKATVLGGIKEVDYKQQQPGNMDRARYDLNIDPDELVNLVLPGC